MFEQIDLELATTESWDVVLIGSSFASMFFLAALPPNLRVLIVEKGTYQSHEDLLAKGISGREPIRQDNRSGKHKDWVAHTKFGGNSNCWWGQSPRFHPSDFRLKSLYGQGEDWPIDYETLEPHYVAVERIMEITGEDRPDLLPRSAPFPYPAHEGTRLDKVLWAERPDIWLPTATARSNGGSRANCCATGVCSKCPVDAKFTILNGIGNFRQDGVSLLMGAEALSVDTAAGLATGVQLRTAAGREAVVRGDLVGLGANAIFNAAIMLRSGLRSPALGRYLHEQVSATLAIDVAQKGYYGGTSITGHGYGFYDGAHRSEVAGVLLESFNAPAFFRPEFGRWTERLRLKLVADDLPLADNRVELDEAGNPHLIWVGHAQYGLDGLDWAQDRLQEVFPFELERIVSRSMPSTESHIQGTHRMGTDPATSVIGPDMRTHEVPNLLALGAGAFVTSAAANPTLTLSALSHHAGALI